MSLFHDIAQILVNQTAAEMELDFTEDSVMRVDQLVELLRAQGVALNETLVLPLGAYLGETVCRALGGTWKLDEQELADSSVVVNGCELWPFRRVRQRLFYGLERPLYGWFEMAKTAAGGDIQKLLQTQEQATIIRPTGHDPLVIKVRRTGTERND